MDANTLRALEESITHWEKNLVTSNPSEVSLGGSNCALCQMFVFGDENCDPCRGCPVFEHTSFPGCTGTPYHDAHISGMQWKYNSYDPDSYDRHKAAFHRAAQAELDFLRSLLPTATPVSDQPED